MHRHWNVGQLVLGASELRRAAAATLGAAIAGTVIAGNSVGGNMAAVVAIKAKEAGTPKLRAQVLLWPVTDANFNNGSYNQFAEGHFLTRGMMEWFWDNYTTDPKQRNEIHASPLRASPAYLDEKESGRHH